MRKAGTPLSGIWLSSTSWLKGENRPLHKGDGPLARGHLSGVVWCDGLYMRRPSSGVPSIVGGVFATLAHKGRASVS